MSADAVLRASTAHLPIPPLPAPSFTVPPALSEARVAVVTTGGFMRPGEPPWTRDETSFRVFHRNEPVVLGQEAEIGIAGSFYIVPLSQSDGDRANPPWTAHTDGAEPRALPDPKPRG